MKKTKNRKSKIFGTFYMFLQRRCIFFWGVLTLYINKFMRIIIICVCTTLKHKVIHTQTPFTHCGIHTLPKINNNQTGFNLNNCFMQICIKRKKSSKHIERSKFSIFY